MPCPLMPLLKKHMFEQLTIDEQKGLVPRDDNPRLSIDFLKRWGLWDEEIEQYREHATALFVSSYTKKEAQNQMLSKISAKIKELYSL